MFTWHQSKLPDTECMPGLSLEEGREGRGEAEALREPSVLSTRGEDFSQPTLPQLCPALFRQGKA